MNNFSTIYKKTFKQLLFPHGYKLWKNMFYKEIDDCMCFFIKAKKIAHSNIFEVYLETVPYCADITEMEFDPREEMHNIVELLLTLMPEKFSAENINAHYEYINSRFTAYDDESAVSSLNLICEDMEKTVLPYVHKFTDLQFFYDEYIKICKADRKNRIENFDYVYRDEFIYGLSLKLLRYENALVNAIFQLSRHNSIIESLIGKLTEAENVNKKAIFSYNITDNDKILSAMLKKDPNFLESQIEATKKAIKNSENEVKKWGIIKQALENNDRRFVDSLVEETENSSRKYIRKFLMSK